jgi:ubiquinol-cytochrome c reductase cytochrome b subunit
MHLDAPSDPSVDYPPRPEWYFLFLFQLLKYLPGSMELVGTIILPGLAGAFLFVLPFLDKSPTTAMSERKQWLIPILIGGVAVVLLTVQSKRDDAKDEHFIAASEEAHVRSERAIALAKNGIPPGGPLEMLRNDPATRGADLYAQYCTKCHVLRGKGEYDAPVHSGFGSREWISGMIHDPQDPRYFGRTEIDDMKPMAEKIGEDNVKAVTEWLFAQGQEATDPQVDGALAAKGGKVFKESCMDCHVFNGEGADTFDGPDMTGYGSRAWIEKQIAKPESIYGDLNKMTGFADDLNAHDITMVAMYLRQERNAKPETGPLPKLPEKKSEAQKAEK